LQRPNHQLVCYAAPIRSPHGDLLGVLDVTSHIGSAQEMALAAVLAARGAIESALKLAAYDETMRGGLEVLCQMIDLCPSPALLIEPDGTLRAVNERARARFGQAPMGTRGLGWDTLMQARDEDAFIDLKEVNGVTTTWRPVIERIGPDSRPIAALVFLEPPTPHRPIVSARYPSRTRGAFAKLTGSDPALERAKERAGKLAPTTLPLLLLAETGTGKEHLARAVHDLSQRADGPFVAVNCGALSGDLLESELFGYAPGAFTGARPEGAPGKIEAARGGTLFLDEVAEMSANCQAALLRVLEDGSYYRVGESTSKRADVRVVAATCKDLEGLVSSGKMRRDLYYRLKGAKLTLPPLREREDIEELANNLLEELTRPALPPELSPCCLEALSAHDWPGNIRELKNSLHVAWVLSDMAPVLRREHLAEEILESSCDADSQSATSLAEAEASALEAALESAGGNLSKAARLLGIARSTLYRMLERHGMR
jgi:transcriptional regulator of acetoin/glycerol metabolism